MGLGKGCDWEATGRRHDPTGKADTGRIKTFPKVSFAAKGQLQMDHNYWSENN